MIKIKAIFKSVLAVNIYYSKKINIERLKSKVKRKDDIIKFKNYCGNIIKKSNLKNTRCFVCGNSTYKNIINVFGFDYVQCLNCSHAFVSKLPIFEKIKKSYSSDIFNEMTLKLYANKELYQYRIDNIAKPKVEFVEQFIKKGKWLDIGCGSGEIIYYAKTQGWDVIGLEVNKIARDFALKYFGLSIENKLIEDTPPKIINLFDVISMFGVLEHLTKPKDILKTIYKNSKNNVKLVIEVPNFDSFSSLCQNCFNNVNRHLAPFAHIPLFT